MAKSMVRTKIDNAVIRAGMISMVMTNAVFCDQKKTTSKVKYCFQRPTKDQRAKIQAEVEAEFPGKKVELIQTSELSRSHGGYYGFHWGFTIRVSHDVGEVLGEGETVVDMKDNLKQGWKVVKLAQESADTRKDLIVQLQSALKLLKDSNNKKIRFEIDDTDFAYNL